ncbi:Crp/Fnr family transcriptional regulator [Terrimonas sp. NA20]|uniref:Crp/Fnr family transcriptional regulator n=1 Tax=Terrimonas ginsenosidimutans TaxID=2908004 RepID=A0ABS9KVN4_9BACT|nr:Crp/Fnr family transcriptional regulator [Terrimonas ginsenosidimutans]MCG2616314.1 Crp/Fnr family transcriptional regulator [Terrimonas ginsenosidimutans]
MRRSQTDVSPDILTTYFNNILPLSAEEVAWVAASFHARLYRKKQYVLQEGDSCLHFNFVVRGCLRLYKIDEKGAIHTLQFAPENHWISDLGSFHGLKPTALSIDALEDTVVLQITRDELVRLYEKSVRLNRIFRVLVENAFINLQERLLHNISSTAEHRYQAFLDRYPELSARLSQVQIASYLGVTPEFLSRLRNQKAKQGSDNS